MKLFLVVLLAVGALGAQPRRNNGRVVGGSDAPEGAYPFIVKLQDFDGQFCAGAIIDEFTVVTAAHCAQGLSPANVVIVAGTNQVDSGGDEYKVSDVIVHPGYFNAAYGNDIAILKIVGPIRYTDRIEPIELETDFLGSDVTCIGIGWGSLSFGASGPINLQDILLKTVTTETCKEAFDSLDFFIFDIIDKHLCTFTKVGEGMCHGDSGGPLSCGGKLSGVVSGGYPCAEGIPDVFTRVSEFVDWINSNRQ